MGRHEAAARRSFRWVRRVSSRRLLNTPVLTPLAHSHLWGYDDGSDSDEDGEYFQEGYEESFIDDEEGAGDSAGLDNVPISPPSHHEDEGDEELAIVTSPAVVRQRNRLVPIVISSDEEDDEYTDADTHGDYGQAWVGGEDEEGGYHDARSDSDDHGDNEDLSDDESRSDGGDLFSFYGYL